MRKGILGSLAALAAGAGLSFGQSPTPPFGPGGPPPGLGMMAPGAPGPLATPDGQPIIPPPGMEGAVPYFSMGNGPGGAYGPGGGPGGPGGGYGSGEGVFGGASSGRYWGSLDFLLWQPRSFLNDYPYITSSAVADLGVVGRSTTQTLASERNLTFGTASGFRITWGMAFDESGSTGFELSGLLTETRGKGVGVSSNGAGFPLVAIPFFDNEAQQQGSFILSAPGISSGAAWVSAHSQAWGAEGNLVYNAFGGGDSGALTLLVGARYFEVEESLQIDTRSSAFGVPPIGPGSSQFVGGGGNFGGSNFAAPFVVTTTDRVRTFNEFYAGQIGFRGDMTYGRLSLGLSTKAAAGINRQRVEIFGESILTSGGVANIQPGGIFNNVQDLVRARKDRFAYMVDAGLNLGYNVTDRFRVNVGYNFIYMSRVLRPYSNTPQNLNPSLIPVSPTFTGGPQGNPLARDVFNDTDYWLQGVSFGFQFSF